MSQGTAADYPFTSKTEDGWLGKRYAPLRDRVTDPSATICRVFAPRLRQRRPRIQDELFGLCIGTYYPFGIADAIEVLIENRSQLSGLRALRLESEHGEDDDIWDNDLREANFPKTSPLLQAFPGLEHFAANFAVNLDSCRHVCLRSLAIGNSNGSGTPDEVADGFLSSVFPALEHFEIFLPAPKAVLAELFRGQGLPNLRSLALSNADDHTVQDWVTSPLLPQLEAVHLSGYSLSDASADAIFEETPRVLGLKKLTLSETNLTEGAQDSLDALNYISGSQLRVKLKHWG